MKENVVRTEQSVSSLDSQPDDLFDAYFSLVEASSESPLIYHRWTLISAVAALLGRQVWLPLGMDVIYPNMYICLMGSAGSRKSSAINVTKKLLTSVGYSTFAREKSSSQKFIKDLGDGFSSYNIKGKKPTSNIEELESELEEMMIGEDVEDDSTSEVYITAGELEDFLGQNDGQFISLLTNLWDNLDSYSHGKMTSEDIYINKPTINMIGGTTPTTFATVFPPEVIGQGMLSRMLLIYGGGARCRITIPPPPDPEVLLFFSKHLAEIKEQVQGAFTFTRDDDEGIGNPTAYSIWDTIYQEGIDLQDSRLESYLNRRHIHYYKLCMVLAACELTTVITADIAIKANSILHYTELLMPKALGEFGKSKKGDISQVIVECLEKHPEGLKNTDIFPLVSKDFESMKEFSEVLMKLLKSNVVELTNSKALKLVGKQTVKSVPYVNFNLLREYRDSPEK